MLPEIYTYFITFLVIIAIVLSLLVLSSQYSKKEDSLHYDKIKKWSVFGVLLAIVIVLVGLFAPLILSGNLYIGNFTQNDANNAGTFNGYVAPFVAIAAVITTGLAFFMQYQANEKLKEQIDKQDKQYQLDKFESQFYEMLRLHKENINEIEFENVSPKKIIKGRSVFLILLNQFDFLLKLIVDAKQVIDESFVYKIDQKDFDLAYEIFFHGYTECIQEREEEGIYKDFIAHLEDIVNKQDLRYLSSERESIDMPKFLNIYSSYDETLGHYYRHLYMTVKFVVEAHEKEKILKEKNDCLRYLSILRGQMSNAEQILLFYNWIAGGDNGYGAKWEISKNDLERKYFSNYKMIHNLHFSKLFETKLIKDKVCQIYERSGFNNDLFEQDVTCFIK